MFKKIGILSFLLVLSISLVGCKDTKASSGMRPEVPTVQETIKMGNEKVEITIEDEDAPADTKGVVVVPVKK